MTDGHENPLLGNGQARDQPAGGGRISGHDHRAGVHLAGRGLHALAVDGDDRVSSWTQPRGSGLASTSISRSMPAAGTPMRPRTNDRQIMAITRLEVSSGA